MTTKLNSKKQQRINAELELIIEEMGRAMRSANKEYIANSTRDIPLTLSMQMALYHFVEFCKETYGKEA